MRLDPLELGPWPEGEDTYHRPTHNFFQVGEESRARLAAAISVDIDTEGWPKRREGFAGYVTAANTIRTVDYVGGMLLLQDGTVVYRVNYSEDPVTTTELVSGLTGTARFCELGGVIYWTDGSECGRIFADESTAPGGQEVPAVPTITLTAGTLPAGRYQVVCTTENALGEESGAPKAAVYTLGSEGGLSILPATVDANATHVNVYASSTDQPQLTWVARVAVGTLPYVISSLDQIRVSTRPLRTQHRRGPIPGDGIFSYMGYLVIYRDGVAFRSTGLTPTLWNIREDVFVVPENIIEGKGLLGGFWLLTQNSAWFFAGEPGNWRNQRVDAQRKYAAGSAVYPGTRFPQLQTVQEVAVFLSSEGPVVALGDGSLLPLTPERMKLDVAGKRAQFTMREHGDGYWQLLWTLR